jgi:hypothetical protein
MARSMPVTITTASSGIIPAAKALIEAACSSTSTGGTGMRAAMAISSATLSSRRSSGRFESGEMRWPPTLSARRDPPRRIHQRRARRRPSPGRRRPTRREDPRAAARTTGPTRGTRCRSHLPGFVQPIAMDTTVAKISPAAEAPRPAASPRTSGAAGESVGGRQPVARGSQAWPAPACGSVRG